MMQRWRDSRYLEVTVGAVAVTVGVILGAFLVASLLTGVFVLGDLIASGVR